MSPIVHVTVPSIERVFESAFEPKISTEDSYWKIDEPMVGGAVKTYAILGPRFGPKYFAVSTTIAMPKITALKVRLPEMHVNGQKVELPEVSFTKQKSTEFFVPMNC